MNKNTAFSFVMPAYKMKFLYKAIDSILKQSYKDFELIIVNDSSPENLEEIVNQFQDTRIKYKINEINIGGHDLVANWNLCIKYAKNDYIILATDDDMFEKDFLSKAVSLISLYPNVNIIRSGVKKIDEHDIVLDYEFPLKEYMTDREFTLFYAKGGTISCISNYIFRKDALQNNGGFVSFPHAHYSDDATVLALSYNGMACIPSNEMSFRMSDINLSNRPDLHLVKEQLKATEQYMGWFLKHINNINTNPNDFYERACYGGAKVRYLIMIEKLTNKIPICKMSIALRVFYSFKHLFKKERLRLTIFYFINKLG